MLTLGIDPGLTGALALLDADGQAELLADLPIIRDKSLAWVDGGELQSTLLNAIAGRQCRAVVERVSSRPRQGIASAFCFGVGFGSILSVLQTLQLPLEFVTPAIWKLGLWLSRDKRASLDKARLLFPAADLRLAKHDGRAEALLLAHWAQARRAAPVGEREYGEMYSQALEETEYDEQTLRNAKWVAGTFELSRRLDNVPWSTHQEIARLPPEQQDAVLAEAAAEQLTVREVRKRVRQGRAAT